MRTAGVATTFVATGKCSRAGAATAGETTLALGITSRFTTAFFPEAAPSREVFWAAAGAEASRIAAGEAGGAVEAAESVAGGAVFPETEIGDDAKSALMGSLFLFSIDANAPTAKNSWLRQYQA